VWNPATLRFDSLHSVGDMGGGKRPKQACELASPVLKWFGPVAGEGVDELLCGPEHHAPTPQRREADVLDLVCVVAVGEEVAE
jgi:hypothetical protein